MTIAKIILILWPLLWGTLLAFGPATEYFATPIFVSSFVLVVLNSFGCLWNIRFCWVVAIIECIALAAYFSPNVYELIFNPKREMDVEIGYFMATTMLLPPVAVLTLLAVDWRRFVAMFQKKLKATIPLDYAAETPIEVSEPSSNPYEPPRT